MTPTGTGELERLGNEGRDVLVLGVAADGFEALTREQRLLAYYLYRAAIPGNRIAFDQAHRDALEIRLLLETIVGAGGAVDSLLSDVIHDYLKYVWIHHGQYNHYTHTKYVPRSLTPADLKRACVQTIEGGIGFRTRRGESLDAMLSRLEPSIFDDAHEPVQTVQSGSNDIIAASAVNYYDPGVTAADIAAQSESIRHKLNVRFAKTGNTITPEVYRIGGRYSVELETAAHFLRLAIPIAESDAQRRSLELLVDYYTDGEEATFRAHAIEWLNSDGHVDYLNGFMETYLDPRGVIAQFEGNVSVRAPGGLIDRIVESAAYFEARMPWPDAFKRTEVKGPFARIVRVVVETGDAGPVSPAAYNLPNYNDIRRDHGSRNVILENIENARSDRLFREALDAFYLPEYHEAIARHFHDTVRPLHVYMHEILGHGSGRPAPNLPADPRAMLGPEYSSLEEARADLVSLFHVRDPQLVELGAFPAEERDAVIMASYVTYLQGWYARIDRVPGTEVREAHNRAHHAILCYLLAGGAQARDFGVELTAHDGGNYVRIRNIARAHAGVAEMLGTIQTLKSTGDAIGAHAFFERWGTHLDPDWKRDVERRSARLASPRMKAFVFPRLHPVVRDGQVVDATIHTDEDLTAQQRRFSRLELSRDPLAT